MIIGTLDIHRRVDTLLRRRFTFPGDPPTRTTRVRSTTTFATSAAVSLKIAVGGKLSALFRFFVATLSHTLFFSFFAFAIRVDQVSAARLFRLSSLL